MRVITGTARGRKLQTPAGMEVRPTASAVKEAVFSAIQFEVEGSRVLDLFAGSGQMGVEALSRGARSCVLVDHARESLAAVRQNLKTTGLSDRARVIAGDCRAYLESYGGEPFDIAFLDPPYAADLIHGTLKALVGHMGEGGAIFCEAPREAELPVAVGGFLLKKEYRFGKTKVAQYRQAPVEAEPL